ncbi:unnamed protein product [Adineta ricciae]|uniref:Uncharacterized protein n=1 Tax=Adineta ricciae TaxID=249248 RepID=A0A815LZ62_ADIRI|nr:unnamed protein product [Adineta ricciae]CAF1416422.1 unnamed protein product [Adineta ricciae]
MLNKNIIFFVLRHCFRKIGKADICFRIFVLIGYIVDHTCQSASSGAENNGNVLKEVIFHDHALILFDELDQITAIECREKIIDQYPRSPSFVSVFDQEMFDLQGIGNSRDLFNEIIIVSRVSLDIIFIHLISPMNRRKVKEFMHVRIRIRPETEKKV